MAKITLEKIGKVALPTPPPKNFPVMLRPCMHPPHYDSLQGQQYHTSRAAKGNNLEPIFPWIL